MLRNITRVGLLVMGMATVFLVTTRATAQRFDQITFSGTGTFSYTSLDPLDKHFSFHISCIAEWTGGEISPNQCDGVMYFFSVLPSAIHVTGMISEIIGDDTPPGTYHMFVGSTFDPSFSCQLMNMVPITHGPTNTVNVSCIGPTGGTGISTTAVVSVSDS